MKYHVLLIALASPVAAAGLSDDIRILNACERAFAVQSRYDPNDPAELTLLVRETSVHIGAENQIEDRLSRYSPADQQLLRAEGADLRSPDDPIYSDPRMIDYCMRELRRIAGR